MKFALLPEGKLQVGNQNISKRGEEVGAERRLHNEVSSDNVHAESRPCRPHSLTQVTGSGDLGWDGGHLRLGSSPQAMAPEPQDVAAQIADSWRCSGPLFSCGHSWALAGRSMPLGLSSERAGRRWDGVGVGGLTASKLMFSTSRHSWHRGQ